MRQKVQGTIVCSALLLAAGLGLLGGGCEQSSGTRTGDGGSSHEQGISADSTVQFSETGAPILPDGAPQVGCWLGPLFSSGGDNADWGYDVAVAPDGDLVVAGFFGGAANICQQQVGGEGSDDILVFKLDPLTHVVRWAFSAGGSETDDCFALEVDAQGGIYVTGFLGGETRPSAGRRSPSAATPIWWCSS